LTEEKVKSVVSTKDAAVECVNVVETRSVGVAAKVLTLDLPGLSAAQGSPMPTPDLEKPPVNLNLCDKCHLDIKNVAAGIIAGHKTQTRHVPPPTDQPWISKIPRPIVEGPDPSKLRPASSIGNLYSESMAARSHLLQMQRSKSNLTPTMTRKTMSPLRNIGTPPPHPNLALLSTTSAKRVQSPLARSLSSTTATKDQKSLIPKRSPQLERKLIDKTSQASSGIPSPAPEMRSQIPRIVTPPVLRKMYPKAVDGGDKLATPDRNVVRKNTYTKILTGVNNPNLDKIQQQQKEPKENLESDEPKKKGSFPLPGSALFTPIKDNRTKAEPSREMRAALKVFNESLTEGGRSSSNLTSAINIIQQEWFKTSSTKQSNPLDVEDYLDAVEEMSKTLLDRVVNLTDVNGNTALHYSVSHGNFDVISILLDSKVANTNILNKAGYTCIMLISLAAVLDETHKAVVSRLFSMGNVNIRSTQHGQTALMLAASHGRLDMVRLLLEAGANVNVRDEDGSTALMCAAEHGHANILKYLLSLPDTDVTAKDNDGLTALAVAMEAGHRDLGVLLYAHTSLSRGTSPYSSMRVKGTSTSHSRTASPGSRTPVQKSAIPVLVPGSKIPAIPQRARRNSLSR